MKTTKNTLFTLGLAALMSILFTSCEQTNVEPVKDALPIILADDGPGGDSEPIPVP